MHTTVARVVAFTYIQSLPARLLEFLGPDLLIASREATSVSADYCRHRNKALRQYSSHGAEQQMLTPTERKAAKPEIAGSKAPKVTVVVLNFNGGKTLERCIQSVLDQSYSNFDLVVVDNASTDGSIDLLTRFASRIRVVRNRSNLGYTGGMNVGARHASEDAELIGFVTPDTALSDGWLQRMVDTVVADPQAAAVSSNVYDESKKASLSLLRILYPSGQYYVPLNVTLGISEVDFPSGEAFLIRKPVFRRLGGFDEGYFAYYEDGDLGWRLRLAGMKVLFDPEAVVRHKRSSAFATIPLAYRVYLLERNRIMTCLKNFGALSLLAFLMAEALMLLFHSTRSVTGRDHDQVSKAYAKALLHVVKNFGPIHTKRRLVQTTRKRSDRYVFRNSLPVSVIGRPGLVIAYSPRYRKRESWYLAALHVLSTVLPPSNSLR